MTVRFTRFVLASILILLVAGCYRPLTPGGASATRPVFRLEQASTKKVGEDVTLHTFQNGLTLIHGRNTANRIAGAALYIRTGASDDPPDKSGLSHLLMRTLTKGTKNRTADEISEEAALLGLSLSSNAGQDFCSLTLQCIVEDLPAALELLTDILHNPTFPVDEFELERKRTLASIRIGEDQPSVVASKAFKRALFGSHPYSRPVTGTPETLPGIEPMDLAARHEADFVPSNMVMSVVGDLDFEELRGMIAEHFGETRPKKDSSYEVDKIIAPGSQRVELVKDSEQGYVLLGHLVCEAGHPDEAAVRVATTILGGGMSSRLFTELRDRQGLAYAVGASNAFLQDKGLFLAFIGTSYDNLLSRDELNGSSRAEHGIWEEILKLRREPVSESELARARNYIEGSYLRDHERNAQQAGYLAYWHVTGRSLEYDDEFLEAIRDVSARDVMRVANKYFLEPTVVVLKPAPAISANE